MRGIVGQGNRRANRQRWVALLFPLALLFGDPGSAMATELPGLARRLLTGSENGKVGPVAGFDLVEAGPTRDGYRLVWRKGHEPDVEVRLQPRAPGAQAFATTASFDVSYRAAAVAAEGPSAQFIQLTQAVADAIAAHDPGGWRLPPATQATTHGSDNLAVDAALRTVTWGLLLLAGMALGWQLLLTFMKLRQPTPPLPTQVVPALSLVPVLSRVPLLWLVLGLGAVLRLVVPQQMVMVYMGHELLTNAAELGPTPKYGPAAQQWLHLLQAATGPRWPAAVALDQVCGALQLPVLAALLLRLQVGPAAVLGGVTAVALAPVLLHDAASESVLVPAMLLTLAAGGAWLDHLRTGGLASLGAAWVLGLVAMLARPELLALVPLTLGARALAAPAPRRLHPIGLGVALVLAAAVLGLRLDQIRTGMELERQLGNTPRVFHTSAVGWLEEITADAWLRKNGLLWASLTPVAAWLGIGLGLRRAGRERKLVAAGLLLAFAYLWPSALDLPLVSLSRVQAPAMLVFLATAGIGAGTWAANKARPGLAAAGLAGAFLLTAAWTVPKLWQPDPHQAEEAAVLTAVAALPGTPHVLLHRTHVDVPLERVQLGFPNGLLGPQGRTAPLGELLSGRVRPGGRERVFAWLGVRCQMRPCAATGEHPACRALRDRFVLKPVQTSQFQLGSRDVPPAFNPEEALHPGQVPDLDFPWCWQRRDLELGLYEVTAVR